MSSLNANREYGCCSFPIIRILTLIAFGNLAKKFLNNIEKIGLEPEQPSAGSEEYTNSTVSSDKEAFNSSDQCHSSEQFHLEYCYLIDQ